MSEELRLSVSKTKTFNQCKKQFEFNYILKLPKKTRDYLILGKFCHKALEDFHSIIINGSTLAYNKIMAQAFTNAWAEFKENMTPEMKKEGWDIIDKYLKKFIQEQKEKKLNIIAVEKNFYFNISDNVILNGMIDRIQIDDDNVVHVADYKTTKNKKYLKNDWFQLLTYAYVILMEDPTVKKVRGSYILLRHDSEYITAEFDLPEILAIKDKYLEYARQITEEKEFTPNPTVLCSWCDFLESCDQGKQKVAPQTIYGEVSW